jgi:hypothetical protein
MISVSSKSKSKLDQLFKAIDRVIDSASNQGCDGDLTVVTESALEDVGKLAILVKLDNRHTERLLKGKARRQARDQARLSKLILTPDAHMGTGIPKARRSHFPLGKDPWKKIKYAKRKVWYCPKCGWESFNKDAGGEHCGKTRCTGFLTKSRIEEYEV